MCLNGLEADLEQPGDHLAGTALRDQLNDLAFPSAEGRNLTVQSRSEREKQCLRQARRKVELTASNCTYGCNQVESGFRLEQVAAHTRLKKLPDNSLIVVDGEYENFGARRLRPNLSGYLETTRRGSE